MKEHPAGYPQYVFPLFLNMFNLFVMFNYFCIFFDSFHYFSSIVSTFAYLLQFGIIYSDLNLLFLIIIYYFLFFPWLWSLIRLPVLEEINMIKINDEKSRFFQSFRMVLRSYSTVPSARTTPVVPQCASARITVGKPT